MKTEYNNISQPTTLFSNEIDVIQDTDQKILRKHDLKRAATLGTVYNQESRIFFKNKKGEQETINCKVIGVTDRNVLLKNQSIIPIRSVYQVIV